MPFKILFRLFFPKEPYYADAIYFYRRDTLIPFLNGLSEKKHAVIVSNTNNCSLIRQTEDRLFPQALSILYVTTPSTNAFSEYDTILKQVLEAVPDSNTVVFCAFGPAGKVMIPQLAKLDVRAHDIGHGFSLFFQPESQERQIKWSELGNFIQKEKVNI